MIHLTTDFWLSDNGLAFLELITYYRDEDGELTNDISGLRKLDGLYTGENMCRLIIEIREEYVIWSKIGNWIMDNASNNNTLMEYFAEFMLALGFSKFTSNKKSELASPNYAHQPPLSISCTFVLC